MHSAFATTATTDTVPRVGIRVARLYEGPPGMTNGGWACGLVAGLLTGPDASFGTAVEVTLRAPVPLETPVHGEVTGDSAFLSGPGDTVLARARVLTADETAALAPPPPFVPPAVAERAGAPDVCLQTPFPTCYVCGDREGGLRITVGPVPESAHTGGNAHTGDDVNTGDSRNTGDSGNTGGNGRTGNNGRVAGVWVPPSTLGDLPLRYVWAALDCPTGLVHLTDGGKALLGRLTMTAHRTPVPGERLVVVAAATGADRRKLFATAALYTPAGDLVANSVATWITI